MAGEPFAMSIGGAEKQVAHDGPRYSAIYEIDALTSLSARGGPRRSKRAAGRTRRKKNVGSIFELANRTGLWVYCGVHREDDRVRKFLHLQQRTKDSSHGRQDLSV
jgi:hypothetical protein